MGKSSSPCPGVVSAAVAPRRKGRQPLFPAVLSPLPDQSANGVGGLHRCSSMAASSSTQPKRRTTLFFAGEIVGCTNLTRVRSAVQILARQQHSVEAVAGRAEGTSHADAPAEGENMMVFQHPISVCYEANGLATDHDWPGWRWRFGGSMTPADQTSPATAYAPCLSVQASTNSSAESGGPRANSTFRSSFSRRARAERQCAPLLASPTRMRQARCGS